jgi:hypothetical protein
MLVWARIVTGLGSVFFGLGKAFGAAACNKRGASIRQHGIHFPLFFLPVPHRHPRFGMYRETTWEASLRASPRMSSSSTMKQNIFGNVDLRDRVLM